MKHKRIIQIELHLLTDNEELLNANKYSIAGVLQERIEKQFVGDKECAVDVRRIVVGDAEEITQEEQTE